MTLQGAIEWIQDQVATVNSTANNPDNPADTANSTNMWIIAYPAGGEITSTSDSFGIDLDTIRIQVLTPRGDSLSEAMQHLEGYPHNIARKIQADPTMNGQVETFGGITYTFIAAEWSGVPTVGYSMDITGVKTLTSY